MPAKARLICRADGSTLTVAEPVAFELVTAQQWPASPEQLGGDVKFSSSVTSSAAGAPLVEHPIEVNHGESIETSIARFVVDELDSSTPPNAATTGWLRQHLREGMQVQQVQRAALRALLQKCARNALDEASRSRVAGRDSESKIRIMLGAHEDEHPGWISTNINELNAMSALDFAYLFRTAPAQAPAPAQLRTYTELGAGAQREERAQLRVWADALVAEHVWEHLSYAEGLAAARL